MSDERHETVETVAAEMRNESHAGDESCLEWVGAKMRTYADRIEAAHQREVAELEREVAELRECLKEAVTEVCNRLEKCGFKEPCVFKTCYVQKWRKALKGSSND